MIISRTPFRISLFGGGTDYPVWYNKYSGQVISATINKYCFITARYLPPFFDYNHRIRYYKQEEKNMLNNRYMKNLSQGLANAIESYLTDISR